MDTTNYLSKTTKQFSDARRKLVKAIEKECDSHGGSIEFPYDGVSRFLFDNGKNRCHAIAKRIYRCGDDIILEVEFIDHTSAKKEDRITWHIPVPNLHFDELHDVAVSLVTLLTEEENASTTN